MKKIRKQNIYILVISFFLIGLSVGYAYFSETVGVGGTVTQKGNFDVGFYSSSCTKSSTGTCSTSISSDRDTVTVNVSGLESPGHYVTVTVTVKNYGTIPAVLSSYSFNSTNTNIEVVNSTVSSAKGVNLAAGSTKSMKFLVRWKSSSTTGVTSGATITATLNYSQNT